MSAAERREIIEQAATEVFAERGYQGASIDEIARRSGVSAPVVYDHFESKRDLHRRLLERHRDELLRLWDDYLPADAPLDQQIPRSIEAWAAYVESHPFAARMFFRDTTGDPDVQADHARVQAEARAALVPIFRRLQGSDSLAGSLDPVSLELLVEYYRSALTGVAIWWTEHPDVPREQVVATAINVIWLGMERVLVGEQRS
jgi:AcrR family transcriptional regulator